MNPNEAGVSVYWRSRAATLEESVDIVVRLNHKLAGLGPPFDDLYEATRKGPVRWSGEREFATLALLRGRNWTDTRPREVLTELGYEVLLSEKRVGFWKAGVWVRLGATTDAYPNMVHVDLPVDSPHDAATTDRLRMILDICLDELAPDWATISSNPIGALSQSRESTAPRLGWFLYLADAELERRQSMPSLPSPARVGIHKGGALVRLTENWFDPEDTAHASLFQAVEGRLLASGFLGPATASTRRG